MPKLPMDYSKCCIYKIEHIDNESLVYVGHTTNFDKRKTQHKINCNYDKSTSYNLKVYQMIRENGEWEMFKMIEVEKYPCNDKREAERRENEVMKDLKANMNKNRCFITEHEKKLYMAEYRESNKAKMKEYTKEYYKANKEKKQEQMKEYYETNKEKVQEYKKNYNEANKEKIQEKRKEYYELNKAKYNAKVSSYHEANKAKLQEYKKRYNEDNKDKIAEKRKIQTKCLCGCVVTKPMLKRHQASKKHLDKMNLCIPVHK